MSQKQSLEEIKAQLKEELIENLSLEDIGPEDITNDEVLFGDEGIGLDSLDAVEIVVFLQRIWGIEIQDMEEGREILVSIDTIANHIYSNL
ncbi:MULTISPECIES: acyl carrier protein [Desulfobacula]|uniref:Acyl-carrier protein-like protein n=2 Tax=Desulfobacula TaxID=28222 RepID=K0NKB9_DESTT|nr:MULTISPECIES: acyl carrier protein [Desulfobacula]CCK82001.1 acyl-carrier protein-like protein [Desulfobacula toluolica Tol2]SDU43603.1 acyl carrier protein [Desulfobacula phenolica]